MTKSLPDLASVPDVDGRPFTEVFDEHFEPLTAYEAEHGPYAPKRIVETGELVRRAGLADLPFGRERGTSVELDDNGDGPYLAISVRNGGYEPMCLDDGIEDCGACDACIQYRIPDYPGYVHSEHSGGDSVHYFELPGIGDDEQLPGANDEHGKIGGLADALGLVERRKVVPWYFLPAVRERDPKVSWGNIGRSDDVDRIEHLRARAEFARTRIAAITEAMNVVPMPQTRPEPRKRRKIGVSGKPLRSMEPVPVRDLDTELVTLNNLKRSAHENDVVPNELATLARTPGLDPATVEHLNRWATSMRSVGEHGAAKDAARLSNTEYAVAMARIAAPGRLDALRQQVDDLERRIAGIEAKVTRSRDADWRNWPGDDHGEYVAWMAANGYEVRIP